MAKAKKKKGDKSIKIGTFDSNKHLTPLNVIGFIATLNKFNELNDAAGTPSTLFQSYADTNVIEKSDSSTAYTTFGEKSGLCNRNMMLSPIGDLLLKERIDIHEYEFLLLTKQWIWLDDSKKHLLKAFFMAFHEDGITVPEKAKGKKTDEDTDTEDVSETASEETPKKKKKENFADYFSASVGPKLSSMLGIDENEVTNRLEFFRTALLISRLCIIKDNVFKINPETLNVWRMICEYDFAEPSDDPISEDYYNYLGNTTNGIFEIDDLEPIKELYPNLYNIKNLKEMNTEQKIYYGAPGTGKSNEIKKMTAEGGVFTKDCTFRTTFHPDYDYASFVGAYKPYWNKEEGKIVYGFRPQPFLKAYMKAWKNPTKQVALVVEEINRGNCAQIFGDIFQLLDREKNGLSKYPIECDVEMQELLAEEFKEEFDDTNKEQIDNYYSAHYDNAFEKIKNGEILALPMNLSILATMNTSDQSLFPMDSAFKRRWEWIYEPIVEGTSRETGESLKWKIELGKYKLDANQDEKECVVDWWKFLQKINAVIYSLTSSEDKQLGYFFCQPDKEDGKTISKNLFVGKVIFYLWNEIFKDYAFDHDVCKKENKSDTLYFADFYDGKNVIKQTSLVTFIKHLNDFVDKEIQLIEEKVKSDALNI